ncbi:MAG: class I SAM-dependent methyltransferase [Planctomycetota bacterium]|nr:MAG: class I SAM-dependent methyltransferase [Planctomycetota bacterium]
MADNGSGTQDGNGAYGTDLAFIHDAGFGIPAQSAARTLLPILHDLGFDEGQVVELGCGSGIQAAEVTEAGFDVLGYDISQAMVDLACQRVPTGTFRCGSFVDAEIPPCVAVTAVGEIFNYLFDRRNTQTVLKKVFRRVYSALAPGGVFLFDVALVGRVPTGRSRTYSAGDDWACLYEAVEDDKRRTLTRDITTFRKSGDTYRREHELHRLRLYQRDDVLTLLRTIGFRVRTLKKYDEMKFPPGYLGFLAIKPR